MTIETKLSVLKKVALLLNQHNITWAVGASLLLYFKGYTRHFNDIDISIAESDGQQVQTLLNKIGQLHPKNPHSSYKTKMFLEYTIENVDFDIMAGFTIVAHKEEHYFPLEKRNIQDFFDLEGVSIPLQTVEEWKEYYTLMGRTEKVALITEKQS